MQRSMISVKDNTSGREKDSYKGKGKQDADNNKDRRSSASSSSTRQTAGSSSSANSFGGASHFDTEDGSDWIMSDNAAPLVNVFTMGWMEDGRLGYRPDNAGYIQSSPRPVFSLFEEGRTFEKYVCKSVSAGGRHSLFLMISCNPKRNKKGTATEGKHESRAEPKPLRKLMLTGLNQLALCEEKGFMEPVEVLWTVEEEPMEVWAANGNCYVLSTNRDLYSWGHGRYGVLGHLNTISNQIPTRIEHFYREKIKAVATGSHHVVAITVGGAGFAWGKNDKGQLGIGHESPVELTPVKVALQRGEQIVEASCGSDHVVALVRLAQLDSTEKTTVYGWGDESRGQLGSGDAQFRSRPQENRWVTKFLSKKRLIIGSVCAGGSYNLAIVNAPTASKNEAIVTIFF
jgi:hypothetical protein